MTGAMKLAYILASIAIAVIVATAVPALILVPNSQITSNTVASSGTLVHFYVYGHDWCPYTRGMDEFLKSAYGETAVTFYNMDTNHTYKLLISSVIRSEDRKYNEKLNLTPVTVMAYNNTVVAIFLGEIRNRALVENFLWANRDSKIPVFVSKNGYDYEFVGFLVIENGTHQDFIDYITGKTTNISTTFEGTNVVSGCAI